VWRETYSINKSVRAVKVISKRDARLSPGRWTGEITNFTALKEVFSDSSKPIIPLIIHIVLSAIRPVFGIVRR